MNVIYSLSEMEDWVDIARHMQKERGWNPVFWVSTDTLLPKIRSHFPSCLIQEYMRGNRAEFSTFSPDMHYTPLDRGTLEEYVAYEKSVLKMMDRIDPTRENFTCNQRVEHYYAILTFWLYIFDTISIDCVLFNEFPHSPLDYILYAVAKQRGVTILRFAPTHVDSRVLLGGTLEYGPYFFGHAAEAHTPLDEKLAQYRKKLKGEYEEAVPFYMQRITGGSLSLGRLYALFVQSLRYLFTPPQSPLRGKYAFISDLRFAGLYLGYYRIRGNLYKRSLRKAYEREATEVDLSRKYIYIPLHYQPEKTTSPEGGFFVDQYIMIAMISKLVPEGWKVYVKEHVSQFSSKLYGERGRDRQFYGLLSKLGNVELVPLSYQSFDLIDHAVAVATVTGTAALEAVHRGKYAFVFGYPWFRDCEGIIPVDNTTVLAHHLQELEKKAAPSEEKMELFFKQIERSSVRGYTALGQNRSVAGLTQQENVKNLVSLLESYIENETQHA